jgi:Fe-S-cluster-containing dehydrogenase component
MNINRREFLKLSAAGIGTAAVTGLIPGAMAMAAPADAENGKAVLYDATLCLGESCRLCELACRQWNKLSRDESFTHVNEVELAGYGDAGIPYKHQCLHCLEPACVEACLVGALQKTADGPVTYNDHKCIGCRYCMMACPFGVPAFQWDQPIPWIRKCTFCADRLEDGLEPSCVGICPADALKFGTRGELLAEAKQRIADAPDKYTDHIYGEHENGGTSWLYLSPAPFEEVGLPSVGPEPVGINAGYAMSAVLPAAGVVAAAMTGIYWLNGRKDKMKEQGSEGKEVSE